jgi:hypothetical protein
MKLIAIILLLSVLSTPALADEVLRLYRKAEARLELAVDHGRRCKQEIRVIGKEQDECDAFAGAAIGWRNASRELKGKVNMNSVHLLGQLDKGDIGNYKRLLGELDSILEYLDAHREAVR